MDERIDICQVDSQIASHVPWTGIAGWRFFPGFTWAPDRSQDRTLDMDG